MPGPSMVLRAGEVGKAGILGVDQEGGLQHGGELELDSRWGGRALEETAWLKLPALAAWDTSGERRVSERAPLRCSLPRRRGVGEDH